VFGSPLLPPTTDLKSRREVALRLLAVDVAHRNEQVQSPWWEQDHAQLTEQFFVLAVAWNTSAVAD